MKIVQALKWELLLVASLSGTGYGGGGEGPCPVPESPSTLVSKKFHPTRARVEQLQFFEAEARFLTRGTDGSLEGTSYDPNSSGNACSASFATFPGPWSMYPVSSLEPEPMVPWLQSAELVIRDSSRFVGAIRRVGPEGTSFQLYEVDAVDAEPKRGCSTPAVSQLQIAWGSSGSRAFFSRVRRLANRSEVTIFRLDLDSCGWAVESHFVAPLIKSSDTPVFHFDSGAVIVETKVGVYWKERNRSEHFAVRPITLMPLHPRFEAMLVHNHRGDLQVFVPASHHLSTFLSDVLELKWGQVAFSDTIGSIFVSAAVHKLPGTGIYEFKLH